MSDKTTAPNTDEVKIEISDGAILQLILHTIEDMPEIHSLSTRFYDNVMEGITRNFGGKKVPGISIKHKKDVLEINVYINARYGCKLNDTAQHLRKNLQRDLFAMLGIESARINIHFDNLIIAEEENRNEPEGQS